MLSNKTLLILSLLSSAHFISTACDSYRPTFFCHDGVNYVYHNGVYYHDQKKSSHYEITVTDHSKISNIMVAITTVAQNCPATELKSIDVDYEKSKINIELYRWQIQKLDIFAVGLKTACKDICPINIRQR